MSGLTDASTERLVATVRAFFDQVTWPSGPGASQQYIDAEWALEELALRAARSPSRTEREER